MDPATRRPLDHRAIQRALFRMQMDPAFAARILSGDREALARSDLEAEELALVRELDPAGLSADPGSKRRLQVLGNVASEFTVTLALAARRARDPLRTFPGSTRFHDAVRRGASLPLAFAEHLADAELGDPVASVLELETALARLRRLAPEGNPDLAAGHVWLAPRARLLELPAGTLALADDLRARMDAAEAKELPSLDPAQRETLLLVVREQEDPAPWLSLGPRGLPRVQAETLEPGPERLLRRLERPADATALLELARELGAEAGELEAFVESLVAEGVLVRGSA